SQKLVHLLQLEFIVGADRQNTLLTLDGAFAALEIEACPDLARHTGKGIVNLSEVDPRNDVEARHGRLLRRYRFSSDIACLPPKTSADQRRRRPGALNTRGFMSE